METNFANADLVKIVERTHEADLFPFGELRSAKPLKKNPYLHVDSMMERKHTCVTLLGNAAHPMATHRGTGANSTIRDAKELAQVIASLSEKSSKEIQHALEQYEEKLFPNGFKAVAESYQSTEMIHMSGIRVIIRNTILRIVGFALSVYQKMWG